MYRIYVTNVANFVNLSNFRNLTEIYNKFLIYNGLGKINEEEIHIKKIKEGIVSNLIKSDKNIKEIKEEVKKYEVFKNVEKEEIKQIVNCTRGIILEDSVYDILDKMNINVTDRQKQLSYKGKNYEIRGRIDGLYNDSIIEIKNRNTKYNIKKEWLHELVQNNLYMHLGKLKKSKLVSRYEDEINIIEYEYDEELCNYIIKQLDTIFDKIDRTLDINVVFTDNYRTYPDESIIEKIYGSGESEKKIKLYNLVKNKKNRDIYSSFLEEF